MGDPIEANALGAVLGKNRQSGKCLIGSVKTNIGHTETAAGIAGIIKVALALKHKQIPPSLHFNTPNQAIAFEDLNLKVVTELTPWQQDKPLIAGVNSFGFGGTNAHVVMGNGETRRRGDEAMGRWGDEAMRRWGDEAMGRWGDGAIEQELLPLHLLTISAKSKSALQDLAQSYQVLLQDTDESLADICVATQRQRSHFNYRLSCISKSTQQLHKQLTAFTSGKEITGLKVSTVNSQAKKICWLFTGQGSQYVGMGQQLYNTQLVFREALNCCAAILESYLDRPLLDIIFTQSNSNCNSDRQLEINRTIYTQPAIFALEYALAQLWLAWGIKPDYVAGHSIGEYVAACIAGVFSLADGLKLVAHRGLLMEELPSSGGMLAIFSSQVEVAELIANYNQEVIIAAINSDRNIVIAGNSQTLEIIKAKLAQIDISSTLLDVSHAFHSPLMKPMLQDFSKIAAEITYTAPQIPLVSNVTAQLAKLDITNPNYWVEHIIQPVKFADSFQFLLQQGVDIFLEVGAKPILANIGKTILSTQTNYSPLLLTSLAHQQDDWQVILNTVAQLYHQGIKIDWQAFNRNCDSQGVKLPTYPFQRQRYWWDRAKFWTETSSNQQPLHPLLGNPLTLAGTSQIRFQGQIEANSPEYLSDHRLESAIVFPATAYLEMALAAGRYIYPDCNLRLEQFLIKQPLILEDTTQLQTVLSPGSDSVYRVQIFSCASGSDEFILHSEVEVKRCDRLRNNLDLAQLQSSLQPYSDIADYYQTLSKQGLNYGISFQGIKQIWQGEREALGYIQLPDNLIDRANHYQLHPALLDACLQLIGTVTESHSGVYLPVGMESLTLVKPGCMRVWTHVTIQSTQSDRVLTANLVLIDDCGDLVAEITGLSLQYLSLPSLRKLINLPAAENSLARSLYEVDWENQDLDSKNSVQVQNNDAWLVFAEETELSRNLTSQLSGILLAKGDRFTADKLNTQYTINPDRPEDFQQLWQTIDYEQAANLRIVYLCNKSEPGVVDDRDCASIFYLMQSLAAANLNLTQLAVVTQQAQYKVNNLSGVWGLVKAIAQEYPSLSCSLIDFDNLNSDRALKQLLPELLSTAGETQVAYHDNQRYVARLTPKDNTLNNPFRLQLSNYGTLDNLSLAPLQRRIPQPGEIEIEVAASGVNFRDVLNALGVLKEYLEAMGFADSTEVPFGGECAGVVVAVGKGVTNFQVGDEVIAAQAVGSLSSHVTVNAQFAIAKPEHLNYAEAATIPTTFLTAYYGLHYLAKIKPGDKILIHAAAGGVGQAAVQLAQQLLVE